MALPTWRTRLWSGDGIRKRPLRTRRNARTLRFSRWRQVDEDQRGIARRLLDPHVARRRRARRARVELRMYLQLPSANVDGVQAHRQVAKAFEAPLRRDRQERVAARRTVLECHRFARREIVTESMASRWRRGDAVCESPSERIEELSRRRAGDRAARHLAGIPPARGPELPCRRPGVFAELETLARVSRSRWRRGLQHPDASGRGRADDG